ncbi:MAG: hypothetical protein EOO71_00580 [Myxococcaceae bacterium]|nr:MAG: hypothetical protein EOO71_00580 [Myxococcaceae bacterium]
MPGTVSGNRSDCRTGWDASSVEGGSQPESPPTGFHGRTRGAVRNGNRPLHDAQGHSPPTTGPAGSASLEPPGPAPQT